MTASEVRPTEQLRPPAQPSPTSTEVPGYRTTGYRTTPREDLATTGLAALLVGGGVTDAWAHANILDSLESFFTPWHAMIYTGFAALALWTYWLAFRERSRYPRWWRDGWPAGYRIGAIGAALFVIGGLADMIWHTAFGVEVNLEATYSPSHLWLVFSGTLLVSSPLRSWWAAGTERGLRTVTGVVSAGLATAIAGSLMLTLSVFEWPAATQAYDTVITSEGHRDAVIAFAAFLVTSIVLLVPLLLIHRRRAVPGAAPTVVGLLALYATITYDLQPATMAGAAGAVLGAALADALLYRLDAVRGADAPLRLPIAGAAFAGLTWLGYLTGLHLHTAIKWPPDLWAGAVVLTALLGAALGGLAARPTSHAPREAASVPD